MWLLFCPGRPPGFNAFGQEITGSDEDTKAQRESENNRNAGRPARLAEIMEIELNRKDEWPAGRESTVLGELARMEIAKHIWDSRRSSKLTGFEYAKRRGTRNMMDPARPLLDRPRGGTRVSAFWTREALEVSAACEGRTEGEDRIVVSIVTGSDRLLQLECLSDGTVRLPDGAERATFDVEPGGNGWSARLTAPWSMLGVRPRSGRQIPLNVSRFTDWTDTPPPEMLPDGFVVNGLSRIQPGLEVSTLSRAVRYPTVGDPLRVDRLGCLVLSPRLKIGNLSLRDGGLMQKELRMNLRPLARMPEELDVRVALVDPYGRECVFVDQAHGEGETRMRLDVLFGTFRGFLYPYRLAISISDPETGAMLAETQCEFIPHRRVRLDPLRLGNDQRGRGRFRMVGEGLTGSKWQASMVNDAGETLDRGPVVADSDETTFEIYIGEVPRGRYRLRLAPVGLNAAGGLECPCNVMGAGPQPCVLLRREDVERLRVQAKEGGLKPHYDAMKAQVDEVLHRGAITECSLTPDGTEVREIAIDDLLAGDDLLMQGHAEDTLFQRDPHQMMAAALVYLIEGDERYGLLAGKMVRVLVEHVLWGDPRVYGADPDLMWKAMYCALAMDWLGELIASDERRVLRDRLVENGLLVYQWAMENDQAYWKGRIANLTPISDSVATVLALCLRDEALDAEAVLRIAREDIGTPMRAFPADGSWPESINYWAVFLRGVILHGAAMESATGADDGVFSLPGMRDAGYFPVYFTPRGIPAGFNDGMNTGAAPFLHLLAHRFDQPLLSLYADAYGGEGENRRSDWYTVMWRSPRIPYQHEASRTVVGDRPAPALMGSIMTGLKRLRVYEEIRWAALASEWPDPALYVSFKSGYAAPGFGHTSRDLNAIQVVAGGEPLIRRSHDYSTPPEGYSTTLVNGRPQGPGTGTFLYRDEASRHLAIAAEADRSFGDDVGRARRHVVMVDGRYLVVLDEVWSALPAQVTFMAHTAGEIVNSDEGCEIRGIKTRLSLAFAGPAVTLDHVAPPDCVMTRLTDRVLHATAEAGREVELLTVIWPDIRDTRVPACRWDGERLEVRRPDGVKDELIFGREKSDLRFLRIDG